MITREIWGVHPQTDEPIDAFWLSDYRGTRVQIVTLGARLNQFWILSPEEKKINICLGSPSVADCLTPTGLYLGSTVGRVAGRIEGGFYTHQGQKIALDTNEGKKTLHGGGALSHALWQLRESSDQSLTLSYVSPHGETGFLGEVELFATFTLNSALTIEYHATPTQDMPLSLTNHVYWNLNGEGSILNHTIEIHSTSYLPLDPETLLPTGEIASVENTPFDFQLPHSVQERLQDTPNMRGYDHSFMLGGVNRKPKAVVSSSNTGLSLEVYTNQPSLHLYTGNFLAGTKLVDGRPAQNWDGLALETQGLVNALHTPQFPSIWIKGGTTYRNSTRFQWHFKN